MSAMRVRAPGSAGWRFPLLALALSLAPRSASAQAGGIWEPPFAWPGVAVHLLHHPNGEILWWSYDGPSAHLWNPGTNTFTAVPNYATNIFCSGHAALKNGLYLVAGGFFVNSTQLFDNQSSDPGQWLTLQNMNYTRFYPTCTTLPDGRILAVAGDDGYSGPVPIPEIFDPVAGQWTTLPNANLTLPTYPFMFLLPRRGVFFAGTGTATYVLDVATQTWTFVANSANDGGCAVMYEPGRIMKCGSYGTATRTTEIIDFNAFTLPAWTVVQPMAFARHDHNLTLLPDGKVLATGGEDEFHQPVRAAELFDPSTNTWTTLASMQVPRQYHSTAQLLNDARVLSAGGDGHPDAEIFNPPYLFAGPRPSIGAAPSEIHYNQKFEVQTPDAARIKRVTLLRLGAVTHSFDHNQRFVSLKFELDPLAITPTLIVAGPLHARIAPPGAYMLFLVTDLGVPSRGAYVFVN